MLLIVLWYHLMKKKTSTRFFILPTFSKNNRVKDNEYLEHQEYFEWKYLRLSPVKNIFLKKVPPE